jgi:uncharacterized protein YggE
MTIRRAGEILALACALSACAGPAARGQTTPVATVRAVQPNIYEIAPEQVVPSQEAVPFVEVSGSASVSVPTDQAQVSFAMETRGQSAAAAASANADAMDRVLNALRRAGLPGLDLETFGYSLQPEYSTDQQRVRSIVGYVSNNNVRATIDDVDQVGRVIDVAIGAGANRVANIAFSATDTEDARAEAMAQAVRNARAQAEVMAEALGYRLGAPLEVHGGVNQPMPRPMTYDIQLSAARAAPTPIEAGDQTVDANVTIRFALGQALPGR